MAAYTFSNGVTIVNTTPHPINFPGWRYID